MFTITTTIVVIVHDIVKLFVHSYVTTMARQRSRTKKDPVRTRQRIVDATVVLHEELGPAATTISAIAERAGVQRLTVYRHFPDERALLGACSSDWFAQHPLPEPAAWAGLEDPAERLRVALTALYEFYRDGEGMLASVLRDEREVPALAEILEPFHAYLRELAGSLATGWGVQAETQRLIRAVMGLAVQFETFRSLARQDLTAHEAADLMAEFVSAVVGQRGRGSASRSRGKHSVT
jgi:AcrR family transcriptional regulator